MPTDYRPIHSHKVYYQAAWALSPALERKNGIVKNISLYVQKPPKTEYYSVMAAARNIRAHVAAFRDRADEQVTADMLADRVEAEAGVIVALARNGWRHGWLQTIEAESEPESISEASSTSSDEGPIVHFRGRGVVDSAGKGKGESKGDNSFYVGWSGSVRPRRPSWQFGK